MRKNGLLKFWGKKDKFIASADKDGGCKVVFKVAFCLLVSWTSEKPESVFQQGLLRQEAKRQPKL